LNVRAVFAKMAKLQGLVKFPLFFFLTHYSKKKKNPPKSSLLPPHRAPLSRQISHPFMQAHSHRTPSCKLLSLSLSFSLRYCDPRSGFLFLFLVILFYFIFISLLQKKTWPLDSTKKKHIDAKVGIFSESFESVLNFLLVFFKLLTVSRTFLIF
jgi:hypothetical protein